MDPDIEVYNLALLNSTYVMCWQLDLVARGAVVPLLNAACVNDESAVGSTPCWLIYN